MKFHKRFEPLKGKVKERMYISFDIETITQDKKNKGRFLFGGLFNGDEYLFFSDRVKMRDFMSRRCFEGVTYVAHKLEYDLNRIFLDDKNLERFYIGSRLISAKYHLSGGKKIYFWDTWNLSFRPLRDLGLILNFPKGAIAFTDNITPEFIKYNQQDCMITYRYMEYLDSIITKLGGQMRGTLAGISLDIYRRRFMNDDYGYFSIPDNAIGIFRDAYYGGRTEVFNFSRYPKVFYYDINSSYPASMLKDFPLLDSYIKKPDIEYDGCSYIHVDMPKTYYPYLPFRTKAGKLIFPCGKFSGYYFNNEIRGFKKRFPKAGIKILAGIHYKKSAPIFKEFVEYFYKARQSCKTEAENFVYKILMNSLYGKFAARNNLESFIDGKRQSIGGKQVSTNVIWSGMITSYSRETLYDLIRNTNAIYCDTDSSVSEKEIPVSKKLGGIGIKGIYTDFQAHNNKDYEYREGMNFIRKIKGIPSKAAIDGTFKYEIPIKYKSAKIRKLPLWTWIAVEKHISEKYDKRIKLKNNETSPILLDGNI